MGEGILYTSLLELTSILLCLRLAVGMLVGLVPGILVGVVALENLGTSIGVFSIFRVFFYYFFQYF